MRKGPEDSATKFSVGTKKKGNDGNIWIIVQNKNGVQRWQRTRKTYKTKKKWSNHAIYNTFLAKKIFSLNKTRTLFLKIFSLCVIVKTL